MYVISLPLFSDLTQTSDLKTSTHLQPNYKRLKATTLGVAHAHEVQYKGEYHLELKIFAVYANVSGLKFSSSTLPQHTTSGNENEMKMYVIAYETSSFIKN